MDFEPQSPKGRNFTNTGVCYLNVIFFYLKKGVLLEVKYVVLISVETLKRHYDYPSVNSQ
jgi:hypothetical protein